MGIKEEGQKYQDHLSQIVCVHPIKTLEAARDPVNLDWCLQRLNEGKNLQEIRHLVGIDDPHSYVWRVLREGLQSADDPKDETEALRRFYVQQQEIIDSLRNQIDEVDQKIKDGPSHEVVETKNGPIVVADKTYHNYVKYKADLTKQLSEENNRSFQNFLDKKKTKSGFGKYAGAKITIISQVPRPLEVLKDVEDE